MHNSNGPNGKIVGKLTKDEEAILIEEIKKTLKTYKLLLFAACLSIIIIMGIIVAPAVYIAMRKQKQKLFTLQQTDPEVFELKGVLGKKYLGVVATMHGLLIDDILIPGEAILIDEESGINNSIGKKVTFQYVPSINKYRLYFDESGKGYNFITNSPIT